MILKIKEERGSELMKNFLEREIKVEYLEEEVILPLLDKIERNKNLWSFLKILDKYKLLLETYKDYAPKEERIEIENSLRFIENNKEEDKVFIFKNLYNIWESKDFKEFNFKVSLSLIERERVRRMRTTREAIEEIYKVVLEKGLVKDPYNFNRKMDLSSFEESDKFFKNLAIKKDINFIVNNKDIVSYEAKEKSKDSYSYSKLKKLLDLNKEKSLEDLTLYARATVGFKTKGKRKKTFTEKGSIFLSFIETDTDNVSFYHLQEILKRIEEGKLLKPTFIDFSGSGLHLKYNFKDLVRVFPNKDYELDDGKIIHYKNNKALDNLKRLIEEKINIKDLCGKGMVSLLKGQEERYQKHLGIIQGQSIAGSALKFNKNQKVQTYRFGDFHSFEDTMLFFNKGEIIEDYKKHIDWTIKIEDLLKDKKVYEKRKKIDSISLLPNFSSNKLKELIENVNNVRYKGRKDYLYTIALGLFILKEREDNKAIFSKLIDNLNKKTYKCENKESLSLSLIKKLEEFSYNPEKDKETMDRITILLSSNKLLNRELFNEEIIESKIKVSGRSREEANSLLRDKNSPHFVDMGIKKRVITLRVILNNPFYEGKKLPDYLTEITKKASKEGGYVNRRTIKPFIDLLINEGYSTLIKLYEEEREKLEGRISLPVTFIYKTKSKERKEKETDYFVREAFKEKAEFEENSLLLEGLLVEPKKWDLREEFLLEDVKKEINKVKRGLYNLLRVKKSLEVWGGDLSKRANFLRNIKLFNNFFNSYIEKLENGLLRLNTLKIKLKKTKAVREEIERRRKVTKEELFETQTFLKDFLRAEAYRRKDKNKKVNVKKSIEGKATNFFKNFTKGFTEDLAFFRKDNKHYEYGTYNFIPDKPLEDFSSKSIKDNFDRNLKDFFISLENELSKGYLTDTIEKVNFVRNTLLIKLFEFTKKENKKDNSYLYNRLIRENKKEDIKINITENLQSYYSDTILSFFREIEESIKFDWLRLYENNRLDKINRNLIKKIELKNDLPFWENPKKVLEENKDLSLNIFTKKSLEKS